MKSKTIKKIVTGVLLSIVLLACEEDAFMTYEGPALIKFYNLQDPNTRQSEANRTLLDSATFSFAFESPFSDEYLFPVIVKISGEAADHDRRFFVEAALETTTAEAGVHYEAFPSTGFTLSANQYIDTMYVKVFKTPEMNEVSKRLTLRLVDGGDFKTGVQRRLSFSIVFSNKIEIPAWWLPSNPRGTYFYGTYSPTKYKLIYMVSNGRDHATMSPSSVEPRMFAQWVYQYIYENPEDFNWQWRTEADDLNTNGIVDKGEGVPVDENGPITWGSIGVVWPH